MHLSGDGAAAEAKARKLQEQAEWDSKVVVDSVKFQSYYGPKTLTQVRSPANDDTGSGLYSTFCHCANQPVYENIRGVFTNLECWQHEPMGPPGQYHLSDLRTAARVLWAHAHTLLW